jgi:hypothetical protein
MYNLVLIDIVLWGLPFHFKLFGLLSFIAGALIYPIYISAMVKLSVRPSRSTWFLWLGLDMVAFGSRLNSGIFDAMLFVYVLGTAVTAGYTIKYGKSGWTKDETFSCVFVVLSVLVWFFISDTVATVCAMSGISVAMWPLLKNVFRGEFESLLAWSIGALSSSMNLLDGQILTSVWTLTLQMSVIIAVLYHWHLKKHF